MGLSQFAFQLWEPGHPTETSRRRQVLPWTRKGEGWGIQCLATHWESFALRLGPLSQPCVAGSSGNVGSFSESCSLIPFLPISLWNRICLQNQARPSGQWASRSPGCLVPSALFPQGLCSGRGGETGGGDGESLTPRARWPQGLPVTGSLAWPARKFCERCCGFLSLQQQ